MEKKCSGIGYWTPKVRIRCSVLHVIYLVELELLHMGTITGCVFQKHFGALGMIA
jgi:hypothetical protein